MKKLTKAISLCLALMLCLSCAIGVSAAAVGDATIDTSRTGSLTIYKYDLTNAEKDGVWDSSYVSTGVYDQTGVVNILSGSRAGDTDHETDLGNGEKSFGYAIRGVEFSYLKIADIVQFSEAAADGRTDSHVEVLYGINKVKGADFLRALGLENGAKRYTNADRLDTSKYFYQSDVLIDALATGLEANSTTVKNALETYMAANGGTAMAPTDAYGKTQTTDLELGLYLVVETAVPEMVVSTTNPFLVSVPMTSVDGSNATDGGERWIYDITLFPKNLTGIPSLEKTLREQVTDTGKNGGSTTDIKVSQEMNNYKGNVHTAILSLKREDAARLGFDNGSRWRDFLRGQTQTLSENLKIPMDHLRWYAAFHNEGHHPHVHLIAYSTVPGEGHLSTQGVEKMRSAFARDIFSQELLFTYQQQTKYRNQIREQGRESISDIVAQINAGTYRNPQIEALLIQLSNRLSRTTGKKVYGYLKPDVKAIVDRIVAELAGDEKIRKLYDLWYEQREDVLRTYTDTFPERVPLEQNKEFKSIRNAVIQEALKITPSFRWRADAGQRLRTEEKRPHQWNQQKEADDDSAILKEEPLTNTEKYVSKMNPVEPVYIPDVARSVSALMTQLARLFQKQDLQREKNQSQQIDRKLRREIDEKKQAMGIRD